MSQTKIGETTWLPGPLGLPRPFWILLIGTLVNRLGGSVFPFLAVYLTRERGFSAELAGVVVGLYAGGGMIAGPIGGALADRIGRRATLLVGTTMAAVCMISLGMARAPGVVIGFAPLLGFFTDLCRPALQAAITDVVPAGDRARAYGMMYWAINLGFAAAAVLAGTIAEKSFALLFAIDAGTTLAFGLIVLVAVPETRPAGTPAVRQTAGLIAPFRDRTFMTMLAIQLPVLLVFQQFSVTLPMHMRAHGIGTGAMGWLFALNGIVIVLVQPVALRMVKRFAHVAVLAWAAVLTGAGFGAAALAGGAPVPVYAAGIAVFTLGEIGFASAAPAVVAELAPIDRRGAYHGAYQLAWGIAGVTAPGLGSIVLANFGGSALWLGCLVAGLLAGALHATVTARKLANRGLLS
jgi:MFS family permease